MRTLFKAIRERLCESKRSVSFDTNGSLGSAVMKLLRSENCR